MKAFKAFIEPFEASQGSLKIKIGVSFLSSSGFGTGSVKDEKEHSSMKSFAINVRIDDLLFYLPNYLFLPAT